MMLISACLCGIHCRYDGGCCRDEECIAYMKSGQAIPVCPEQLGGLQTPRPPAEIQNGDGAAVLRGEAFVADRTGADVTAAFIRGAEQALHIARLVQADRAILRAMSPSCGCGVVYDGGFHGGVRPGDGICAAMLKQHGVHIEIR